jgi:hypothetical protein
LEACWTVKDVIAQLPPSKMLAKFRKERNQSHHRCDGGEENHFENGSTVKKTATSTIAVHKKSDRSREQTKCLM